MNVPSARLFSSLPSFFGRAFGLSFGLALASALPVAAHAFPAYMRDFSDHYAFNGINVDSLLAKESCGTCHVRAGGGGARNAYGIDFDKIAQGQGKGFAGLDFLDSDADGFLNLEEIFAQISPAKDELKPTGRITLALDAAGSLSLSMPAACAKLTLKAFGFQFENGADSTILENVDLAATLTLKGTAGTVLARCDAEGFVGSLTKL